jgi:hypothetical protein
VSQAHVIIDIDGTVAPEGVLSDEERISLKEANDWASWQTSQALIAWLQELEPLARITWASLWDYESNLFNEGVGLRKYPFITFWNNTGGESEWFKFKAISEHLLSLPDDDLVIWVDDEISPEVETRMSAFHPRLEVVIPDATVGVSVEDRARILEMLKQERSFLHGSL